MLCVHSVERVVSALIFIYSGYWSFLRWKSHLQLIQWRSIFDFICEAICFFATLIIAGRKNFAIRFPVWWFNNCDALFRRSFEFTLHFKGMIHQAWFNSICSINTLPSIIVLLASCWVCCCSIKIFLEN